MRSPEQLRLLAVLAFMAVIWTALLTGACRKDSGAPEGAIEPPLMSEPEEYSATVVRTIEEGERSRVTVVRLSRSSLLTREEWSEENEVRALIFRPDLGKIFLLAPARHIYVEISLNPEAADDATASSSANSVNDNRYVIDPEGIERAFADTPASVEARSLPDQTVDNHPCAVLERRAVFSDNHVEIRREFRARDLAGLAIRTEAESNGSRVITERRDVRREVSPDEFKIPDGFKKVEKLSPM